MPFFRSPRSPEGAVEVFCLEPKTFFRDLCPRGELMLLYAPDVNIQVINQLGLTEAIPCCDSGCRHCDSVRLSPAWLWLPTARGTNTCACTSLGNVKVPPGPSPGYPSLMSNSCSPNRPCLPCRLRQAGRIAAWRDNTHSAPTHPYVPKVGR